MNKKELKKDLEESLKLLNGGWDSHANSFIKDLVKIFERYSKSKMDNGWISVEDELPKNKQKVLMFCKREFKHQSPIVIGYYQTGDYENWISYDFSEDENSDITHWQPLPKSPVK
jgi:hypothetical protein